MTILVTGGTGHLGVPLVKDLVKRGHSVRIASSRPRPNGSRLVPAAEYVLADLASGSGLAQAVDGTEVIFHLASDPRNTLRVDVDGTRLLLQHARHAGARHFVYASITGIDRPGMRDYSYYCRKLEVEEMIRGSSLDYSIVRATQFHYFLDLLLTQVARLPLVLPLPRGFAFQPVDESEVAARLSRCVDDGPTGRRMDFVGPEVLSMEQIADEWKLRKGLSKPRFSIPIPGSLAQAFRTGGNLDRNAERGQITWRTWLARNESFPATVVA